MNRRNYDEHERMKGDVARALSFYQSTLALQLCWQLRQGRSDVALWTFGDRSDDGEYRRTEHGRRGNGRPQRCRPRRERRDEDAADDRGQMNDHIRTGLGIELAHG